MNKTVKYILIGLAVFFGIMIIAMLSMGIFGSEKMESEFNNRLNQNTSVQNMQNKEVKSGYKNISVQDLKNMLENKDFTLVNVHVPYIGDIEKTDVNIPFDKIADNLDKLPKDKNAKIVLYCQSGGMSKVASEKLAELGYTNVSNLSGGMNEWRKQGYQLIQR